MSSQPLTLTLSCLLPFIFFLSLPSIPSLSSPFPFFALPLLSVHNEGIWGSTVSSPSGMLGGAVAEIEFGALETLK